MKEYDTQSNAPDYSNVSEATDALPGWQRSAPISPDSTISWMAEEEIPPADDAFHSENEESSGALQEDRDAVADLAAADCGALELEPPVKKVADGTGSPADGVDLPESLDEDAPEETADGSCTNPEERADAEDSSRRLILEAGTDKASLKALALCREKVAQLRINMRPLAARWEDDKQVIIYFRADDKVDFRKLVRELSRTLHARIELRQVGPREQGKLCGLIGKCGYPLCCQTFLEQFAQSTIKMAKTQELALNPMKISGVCGRLLCCLNYEQDMYLDAKSRLPKVNRLVETEYGPGRVIAVNVLKETVTVRLETSTRELRPDQILPAEAQS